MTENEKQKLGRSGENLAWEYLASKGYELVEKNWRCSAGEVDIICHDPQDTLVFVEVKTRSHDRFGGAKCAVDWKKRLRLRRLTGVWLSQDTLAHRKSPPAIRLDLVLIDRDADPQTRITHLKGV